MFDVGVFCISGDKLGVLDVMMDIIWSFFVFVVEFLVFIFKFIKMFLLIFLLEVVLFV